MSGRLINRTLRHGGERSGGGHAERSHGLANDVFAEHRAEGRFAIAAAREWRPARTLQLQIAARTVHVDDFAEQQRPAVTELRRESTELVAGVGLRQRLGPSGTAFPASVATPSADCSHSVSSESSAASPQLRRMSVGSGTRTGCCRAKNRSGSRA